jgi:hypothetical protein
MADYAGVNQTKIDAGGVANQLAKGTMDARLKVRIDEYEAAAVVAAKIIAVCGTLPAGAIIHDVVVWTDALGANTAITVGDSNDAARYISSTAVNTANLKTSMNTIAGDQYTVGTTAGDNQLLITAAGPSAATGTIKIAVIYSQD